MTFYQPKKYATAEAITPTIDRKTKAERVIMRIRDVIEDIRRDDNPERAGDMIKDIIDREYEPPTRLDKYEREFLEGYGIQLGAEMVHRTYEQAVFRLWNGETITMNMFESDYDRSLMSKPTHWTVHYTYSLDGETYRHLGAPNCGNSLLGMRRELSAKIDPEMFAKREADGYFESQDRGTAVQ